MQDTTDTTEYIYMHFIMVQSNPVRDILLYNGDLMIVSEGVPL